MTLFFVSYLFFVAWSDCVGCFSCRSPSRGPSVEDDVGAPEAAASGDVVGGTVDEKTRGWSSDCVGAVQLNRLLRVAAAPLSESSTGNETGSYASFFCRQREMKW